MVSYAYDVPECFYFDTELAIQAFLDCDWISKSTGSDLVFRMDDVLFYFSSEFFISFIWELEDQDLKIKILRKLTFPFVDLFK